MIAVNLARYFRIGAAVCFNKWDLSPEVTERIKNSARRAGARLAGRVCCDRAVTLAQLHERAVVETDASCAEEIKDAWQKLNQRW